MKKILLDTNALALMFEENLDVFDELENVLGEAYYPIMLLDSLEETLMKCVKGSFREKRVFSHVLKVIYEKVMLVNPDLDKELSVDDKILLYALREGCIVVTGDKELRRRLREKNVSTISYRLSKQGFRVDNP
ncbi:MAG: hypothetical protein J7L38_01070 [Thermoproteales archaeon]|nr:hypothetical protein [Thermoproteales archaeon]